jgi:dolichol-phosphate mannosyltransferase
MISAELVVVLPTFNERDNVAEMARRLDQVLAGIRWEAIFVDDDSTDGTREVLARLAAADSRIRFIHRIGRRGLASACIEGMLASAAPLIAVMDADLQHDEALLPRMVEALRVGDTDIVVGSRYVDGGGLGDWDAKRVAISKFATVLGRTVLRAEVTDPMSGFFMLTRDLLERSVRGLSGKGFKILVDILASAKGSVRVRELPFVFRTRVAGDSKLDAMIAYEFALLLYEKLFGHVIPSRFLMFVSVGFVGALLHLAVLGGALKLLGLGFGSGQTLATLAAMALNFILNNVFTHRDRRLKGGRLVRGLLSFMVVCSVGAVASVGIGESLFEHGVPWWAAGLLGGTVGAVWNYSVSSIFVWGRR